MKDGRGGAAAGTGTGAGGPPDAAPPRPRQGLAYRVRRDLSRLRAVKGRGRLATLLDALLFDSGFQALLAYRLGHALRRAGVPLLPAVCRRSAVAFCGVDILPGADLGGGCIIAHGLGLVVGGETVAGEDCTLLHGVTLGELRFDELACPRLGDRVTVGAGAIVLGGITVGDGAMIGAGSVVRTDVPAGCRAAGVPARVLGPTTAPAAATPDPATPDAASLEPQHRTPGAP